MEWAAAAKKNDNGGGIPAASFDMKTPDRNPEDPELRSLLREAAREPDLPLRFQEQVWQRLAKQTAPATTKSGAYWREFITGMFLRPAYATVGLALMITVSGISGCRSAASASREVAAERYVASVNPLARVAP